MTWNEYTTYFDSVLSTEHPNPPYDDAEYFNFAKLNQARMNRWIKNNPLSEETKTAIQSINQKQQWIVITEPWCGDAAHIVPVIYQMSLLNPLIDFSIQLRDNDSEIDKYLTNGSKSIPIFIVRDENGQDVFHWGPRPEAASALFADLKSKDTAFEDIKIALQNFYNNDKAKSLQQEIVDLLK